MTSATLAELDIIFIWYQKPNKKLHCTEMFSTFMFNNKATVEEAFGFLVEQNPGAKDMVIIGIER